VAEDQRRLAQAVHAQVAAEFRSADSGVRDADRHLVGSHTGRVEILHLHAPRGEVYQRLHHSDSDLLARRWVPYSYIYPFAEALAGILMAGGWLVWLSIPLATAIGGIGAVSVFKAVYIDKRELKCACVGGGSNVPLGFVSLTENVMMVAMAVWMLAESVKSARI